MSMVTGVAMASGGSWNLSFVKGVVENIHHENGHSIARLKHEEKNPITRKLVDNPPKKSDTFETIK